MTRIFVTYPNRIIQINPKDNAKCRHYTMTNSSRQRVRQLIQSQSVRLYFRTRAGEHWEYTPAVTA